MNTNLNSDENNISVLKDIKNGQKCIVLELRDCDSCEERLNGMGLFKGAEIRVMHNAKKGPIKIVRYNTRIAIDREMASRIIVLK